MASNSSVSPSNNRARPPKWAYTLVVTVVVLAAAFLAWVIYNGSIASLATNHAQEVAEPIEQALVKQGGVYKSSGGNSGHGADNVRPYYDAFYDVPTDKSAAIALINEIAKDNGYNLTHATPTNRGNLGAVADKYIDQWYFDITSKASSFSDLKDGSISLAFSVGDADHPDSAGHTTVRVNVQLPDVKQ